MAINQTDFITSLTGNIVIINNSARLTIQSNSDLNLGVEGNESFRLIVRRGSNTGPIVATSEIITIRDTSNTITYDSLVESADTIAEGSNVTFVLNTTNLAPGTTLYYDTAGNVTSQSFVSGNTGSFVTSGNTYSLNLLTSSVVPDNETRTFQLRIRENSLSGNVRITSNTITVVDSSLAFVSATGGNIVINDGYKIHTFTSSNTFNVVSLGIPANRTIEYLIVAGGGGGNGAESLNNAMGGGGAGGVLQGTFTATLGANAFIVGSGGTGSRNAQNGTNTRIYGIEAVGGGKGSRFPDIAAGIGGSGGGGSGGFPNSGPHATGGSNILLQGNPGGFGIYRNTPFSGDAGGGGGGGGGAGAAGANAIITPSTWQGGLGGAGIYTTFTTTANIALGGGGGGGTSYSAPRLRSAGGIGGGGPGANGNDNNGAPGTVNTGGGGGGSVQGGSGGSGGSGVIYVRYPYTVKTINLTDDVFQPGAIVQDSNITYTLTTINVSNNTPLYYTTSGNVTTSDFFGGNTGSFTVINANAIFSISIANNIVSGGATKTFTLQLREGSATGPVIASANTVTIYSQDPSNFITATGGTILKNGIYTLHVFTSSAPFSITSGSTNFNKVEYLLVAGGGSGGNTGRDGLRYGGGGGGAGGLHANSSLTAQVQDYDIVVGGGGGLAANGGNTYIKIQGSPPSQYYLREMAGGGRGGSLQYSTGSGGSGGGRVGPLDVNGYSNLSQGDNPGLGIAGQGNPGGPAGSYGYTGSGGGYSSPGINTQAGAGRDAGGSGYIASWVPASYGDIAPTGREFSKGGISAWRAAPFNGRNANAYTGSGGEGAGTDTGPTGTGGLGGSGVVIVRYVKP